MQVHAPIPALPEPGLFAEVAPGPHRIVTRWADCEDDVRAAQRLRHQVFETEMGARLAPPPGTAPGLDVDRFDAHCDHLLVQAFGEDDSGAGVVVGTYRVLGPAQARAAGGYYTDTEFDLAALAPLRPRALELGRSCVHPEWRQGGVILAMWSALARTLHQRGLETMIGCASMSVADGGAAAEALWRRLRHTHLADAPWHVRPRAPLPLRCADEAPDAESPRIEAPALIRGYLRCGARVLGPPALDGAFNTADLPMMLRLQDMAPRYRRHLLGEG